MLTNFFCTNFPRPKEDKLSTREGTNFSATTPSRGTLHRVVSGPKKLIFVLFFRA